MITDYHLFYNPVSLINGIVPFINLNQLVKLCNYTIKKNANALDPGAENELARIVRVNFIYNNLQKNKLKIMKPLFLEANGFNLITVQGDTRLMAADLCGLTTVPCLIKVPLTYQNLFPGWVLVKDINHLSDLTGFESAEIKIRGQENKNIEWIEFSSASTAHHMHDFDQRLRMVKNYIKQQPTSFEFSREWCQTTINWLDFEVDNG
jgi:hypothetical protein